MEDRTLSPMEFGIGAGLAQGATMGMIIGAIEIAVALIVDGVRRSHHRAGSDAQV